MVGFDRESIADLRLYRRATVNFLEHIPFTILYALAVYQCVVTFGQPYKVSSVGRTKVVHELAMLRVPLSSQPPAPHP